MGPLEVRLKNHIGYQRWIGAPLSACPPWLLQAVHTPGKSAFLLHPSSSISLASPACSRLRLHASEEKTPRNGMSMQRAAPALGTLSGTDAPGPASAR